MFVRFKKIAVRGISSVIPKEKLILSELSEVYPEKALKRIIKLTGIESVHIAPADVTASDYCIKAVEILLRELNVDKLDVDALLFVTQTPDYIIPHTTAIMQDRLGLRNDIITFDINYGCAGYIYGLFQAYSLINTGACKNVILCCGDTLSKYINEKDRSLRMVMGDAGSATLISSVDNALDSVFSFYTDGSGAKELIIPAGAGRKKHLSGVTDIETVDSDGNVRTEEDLYMNGMEIMNFALSDVKNIIEQTISECGIERNEINLYLFHQANETIVKYLSKALKIDSSKVPLSVKNNGNTSSCSIPLLMCNEYGEKRNTNICMDNVLLCGFGTGLSVGVCYTNFNGVRFCETDFM